MAIEVDDTNAAVVRDERFCGIVAMDDPFARAHRRARPRASPPPLPRDADDHHVIVGLVEPAPYDIAGEPRDRLAGEESIAR